jgi:hypothetical protein
MNNSQVITTITMPMALQQKLEQQAKHQGISIKKLLTDYPTHTHEMINSLKSSLSQKSLSELKTKVSAILEGIPSRPVSKILHL